MSTMRSKKAFKADSQHLVGFVQISFGVYKVLGRVVALLTP